MKKLLVGICGLICLSGCTQSSPQSSGTSAAAAADAKPLVISTVARRGHLPMDYAITVHRRVRVMDVTTGKKVWEQRVGSNTQLRLASDGVRLNTHHVMSRRLKKGDVYEIVLIRE